FFFFQAEDGIRDRNVTGVQTCALPICTLGLFVGIAVGMLIAMIVALLVGVPTLRLKGDYLAIATLGVSEIIRVLINNLRDITNGPAGISGIPLVTTWELVYFFLIIIVTIIVCFKYSISRSDNFAINL